VNTFSGSVLKGASCGAVASCATPTGDELTESFGDASSSCWSGGDSLCNNTWTVFTGSPTIADVPAGSPSNTACTKGLSFDTTSAAATVLKDLGDGIIPNNVQVVITFSMYIDSSSIGAYSTTALVALNGSNSAMESTTFYSYVGLNKSTAGAGSANKIIASGNSDSCTLDFTEDTWYNITLTLDAAASAEGSTLSDGSNSCNFTRDTDASRYLWVGAPDTGIVGYIGNVRVSTP
jgi:hypothetical protein